MDTGNHNPPHKDSVNGPSHYTSGNIECIDYITEVLGDEGVVSFCLANTIKYIHRHKLKKDAVEDLKKAKWYLEYAIKKMS